MPARSDTFLVSSTQYDAAGRSWVTTDPHGIASRAEYDLLGRVVKTVEDYVDGVPSDADNKTTEYGYGPAGMTSLTARLAGGGSQTTRWVYGVGTATGSAINSNDVVGETRWPDPSTGAASAAEKDTVTVNALGQAVQTTDRNGTVHALTYDALGRLAGDAVTLLGVGVDGAMRRAGVGYDALGNAALVTSYDAASGGNVVNQVKRDFDGLGQLTSEWQAHGAAVDANTPRVQYAHDFDPASGGANRSRLALMTYPDGRVVGHSYGASGGLDDRIGRLSALTDTGVTLEGYSYLGLGTVVTRSHPEAGVDLTYVKRAGEADGEAGDSVSGLDRFGRVEDQRWVNATTGVSLDRHTYGYDTGGNRLYRDDVVNAAFGEVYSYDGLSQVTGFQRGTLNAGKTGLTGAASRSQGYSFDALGNFTSVTTDGVSQARTANRQNEVTGVAGATTPTFDASGNMTGDETGRQFVYDAWNRLVAVKSSGGILLKSYAYDGLGRRVSEVPAGLGATELYYSSGWQVLEERQGGVARASYVWSPVYVDALVARDRDADGVAGNGREERLYALADANHNVTALVGVDGQVKERYGYSVFGRVEILDASYSFKTYSDFNWTVLYNGGRLDIDSGLYVFRYRDYNPSLLVWSSVDPYSYNSGAHNLYEFNFHSPLNYVDPSGLACTEVSRRPITIPSSLLTQAKTIWLGPVPLFIRLTGNFNATLVVKSCDTKCSCDRTVKDTEIILGGNFDIMGGVGIAERGEFGGFRYNGYLGIQLSLRGAGSFSGTAKSDKCHGIGLSNLKVCTKFRLTGEVSGGGNFLFRFRWYSVQVAAEVFGAVSSEASFCINYNTSTGAVTFEKQSLFEAFSGTIGWRVCPFGGCVGQSWEVF